MKKIFLLISFAFAALASTHAQSFSGTYTFGTSVTTSTTNFAYNGVSIPNLTIGGLVTGPGIGPSGSSGNFRATNWTTSASLDLNDYFGFTLTAATDYTFSMTDFNFGVGRSATGTRNWAWYWSTNSFTSSSILTNYTTLATNAGGLSNNAGVLSNADTNSSWSGNVLSISSLTNLTSIQFRLYSWAAEGATGTAGFQGPFTFSGSMIAPPLATNIWSGGSGTWQAGQQGNFSGPYNNGNNSATVFGGSAGTVSVVGGVTSATLLFETGGYSITGDAVTNTLGNITTDAGLTTFSSDLAGTNGLTKAGVGSLLLDGNKTFSGNVTVSAGTLEISGDGALGNSANDVVLSGTLRTTNSVSLGAGRDLSGGGTLDIASGSTLTINGVTALTSLTLANTGTLAFSNVASNPGNITTTYGSGTAVVSGNVNFSAGDKIVSVATGGTLEMSGAVNLATASNTELTKEGDGVLHLSGTGSSISRVQIGRTAAVPTAGGTLRVDEASGLGAQEILFNTGTLELTADVTTANGISFGGRTNGAAVIGGAGGNSALVVEGASRFFRGTGTSGEMVLDVNNTTTFSGGFIGTSGSGTVTGITIGGTGEMIISGASSALVDNISLTDTIKLTLNNTVGGGVSIGNGIAATVGGPGGLLGSLFLGSDAQFVFDLNNTGLSALTVGDADTDMVSFGAGFGIDNLVGLNSSVANGTYTIIDGLATFDTSNLDNLGSNDPFDLGGGKSAYFTEGSLQVTVVPEPSTYALLALSGLALAGYAARRRRR